MTIIQILSTMNNISNKMPKVQNMKTPTIPLQMKDVQDSNRRFNNNVSIPIIGLGTYKFKKRSGQAEKAVIDAIGLGYTMIDTAFIYGGEETEQEVGNALQQILQSPPEDSLFSSISRSDLFITTKQWRGYHGYDATLKCLSLSLKRLQVDYVDLYLIHWPGPAYNTMARCKNAIENSPDGAFLYAKDGHEVNNIQALRAETWRAMEDAVYNGQCKAIGVSNFTIKHLEALRNTARIWPPAVNQVELHPYNPQTELVEYCRKHGIVVQAYASLGGQDVGKKRWNILGGKLVDRKEVNQIAAKYGKTSAQVLLKWATEQGHVVIPKSTSMDHLKENFEAITDTSWHLDHEDMALIASLDKSKEDIHEKQNEASDLTEEKTNELTRLCWIRDPLKMLDFE